MVLQDASLRDALQVIDRSGCEIALVCEPNGRVLGTLTDGDIRRAILSGASPTSRCLAMAMRRSFTAVRSSAGRNEVLDLMQARGISQVPVLDGKGRLVGLHLLRDFLTRQERPNCVVLVAGGKGQRLQPLTDSVPKPMVSVAGRPILERLVLHLMGQGFRRFFISIGHLGHVIENHFGDGSAFGCHIRYLRERRARGTGGALSLLRSPGCHPVVVMNGDLVTQANVGALLDFHARRAFVATVGVKPYSVQVPFGVAEVRAGRLVGLHEKPTHRMLVNAGIYVLSPRAIRTVPRKGEVPITEVLERLLSRGLRVGAHVIEDEWLDIGQPSDLRRARGDT
jgi:dTDP-glucose pyrophosphorylase